MKSISSTTTLDILSLLDSNFTARQIAPRVGVSIGTVSMVRKNHIPNMPKSLGGCPTKLSEPDARHATRLINSGKADTAVQVHKVLQGITNQDFSVQTVRRKLKQAGMKSAVKTKRPFSSKYHQKQRLDFTIAH